MATQPIDRVDVIPDTDRERAGSRALIDQFPSAAALYEGPEHVVTAASALYRRITGNRPLIGLPFRQALPELVDQGFLDLLDRAYATGRAASGTRAPAAWDVDGDGEIEPRIVDYVYQPVTDQAGAVWGLVVYVVDVTEHHHADAALRASEERLSIAQSAGGVGTFDWNIATGTITWTEQEERLFGMAPGTFEGTFEAWSRRVHPDDLARTREQLEGAFRERRMDVRLEFRISLPDGTERWLAGGGRVFYGGDGAPLRMIGVNLDVTERRQAEHLLQEQQVELEQQVEEARRLNDELQAASASAEQARLELSQVFAQAPVAVAVFEGPEMTFELANPFFLRLMGGRDPVGTTVREAFPEMAGQGVFEILDQVYATGEAFVADGFRLEYDRTGTGRLDEAFFNLVYHPLRDGAGAVRGLVAVATEVTDQVRARRGAEENEARFRQLFDNMAQGVAYHDHTGAVIALNPAAARVLAMPANELRGTRALDPRWKAVREDGEPYEAHELPVMRALATGQPVLDVVMGLCHPETDECRWLLVDALPQFGPDGGPPTGAFSTFEDITRRKETEEQRDRALAEAIEANRAKSGFLATMSHELRTPLNAMIGYSDLLLMGIPEPLGPGATEQVRRIDLSARHLLSIIEEILTFSRVEAGRELLNPERVDLGELVREVVAIAEPLAQAKGIGFSAPERVEPPSLVTDPRKLRQILINLVGNAVKFTNRGGVWFHIHQEDGCVEFQVRDTGIGISPEHLDRIFDPFWQADDTRTRSAGGTGLGLTVSRELARLLGGELRAMSAVNEGSTFTITLPLTPE